MGLTLLNHLPLIVPWRPRGTYVGILLNDDGFLHCQFLKRVSPAGGYLVAILVQGDESSASA